MTVAFENALTASPDQSRLGGRPGAAPSVEDVQYPPSSAHPTAPVTSEIQRVNPPGQAIRTFEISGVRGELLTFAKCDTAELEFLMPSHLVVLLPDGISRGCEWSNGRETRKVPSAVQNTIVFNPAQSYSWVILRPGTAAGFNLSSGTNDPSLYTNFTTVNTVAQINIFDPVLNQNVPLTNANLNAYLHFDASAWDFGSTPASQQGTFGFTFQPDTLGNPNRIIALTYTPDPEPARVLLACAGAAALGWLRRRRG